jgi:hypothetical protein
MPFQAPDDAAELLRFIREFPSIIEYTCACGSRSRHSPLSIYLACPSCNLKVKQRSFAGGPEIEDFFDAVLAWAARADAKEHAKRRQRELLLDPKSDD